MVGFCGLQRQHQPVQPHRKTNPRRLGSAYGLAQAVVAAAAEQRILRTQSSMREFEGRPCVVIESAHQPRIQLVGDASGIERRSHGCKMVLRLLVKRIGDLGQRIDDRLILMHLAVQHAQGIRDRPSLAVCTYPRRDRD